MSISSALELELSLISFAGSDSILYLGREGIKEREEGKRGRHGRLFKGAYYCKYLRLEEAINRGTAIIRRMRYLLLTWLTITASELSSKHAFNRKKKGKEKKLGPYGSLGPFYRKNH